METTLSNQYVQVTTDTKGAQLLSFIDKEDNQEYIWNGDCKYWCNRSPNVFPMVCAANNDEISIDGKKYTLTNHGFAKLSEFEIESVESDRMVYKLKYNDWTLAQYPYRFELYIEFTLNGKKLKTEYRVKNADNQSIYFQLGSHTGFFCPIDKKDSFENYYIEFEEEETLDRLFLSKSNTVVNGRVERVLTKGRELHMNHDMFLEGAMVFKDVRSKKVALKSTNSGKKITITYEDMPCLCLWQAKYAPFLCVQPWHGVGDTEGVAQDFRDKEYMIKLEANQEYSCYYEIEIG